MSRILITGGTGSLGHALTRYYQKYHPDTRLIIFSRDELKQAQMREEFPSPNIEFFLGDVRDLPRLHLAFDCGLDTVIHAAALKRVDSVANNPDEVFKTNVEGSRNVLIAARGKVAKCILISSDKAVYPVNAYGVSKAMAEHLFTSFNVYGLPKGTASSVVRYGNVLGSRGSVLEVWERQMREQGRITLTHPRMTRFLITFKQACELVEHARQTMRGGEILVPELEATDMETLADAFAPGVPQDIVGLRPGGEKLHETLWSTEEDRRIMALGNGYMKIGMEEVGAPYVYPPYSSQKAPQIAVEPLRALLETRNDI